jgi:hypothetical protein
LRQRHGQKTPKDDQGKEGNGADQFACADRHS